MSDVLRWDRTTLSRRRDELLDVYAEAMQVPAAAARNRRQIVSAHLERAGLRAAAATDGDQLVGIGYGYRGAPGQWWHDQVRDVLSIESARTWLDGAFEVCELHVRPAWQGKGIGRALLDDLLAQTDAATAVLTTPDAPTRARAFYASAGWVELAGNVYFPGDSRAFAVLAKELKDRA